MDCRNNSIPDCIQSELRPVTSPRKVTEAEIFHYSTTENDTERNERVTFKRHSNHPVNFPGASPG